MNNKLKQAVTIFVEINTEYPPDKGRPAITNMDKEIFFDMLSLLWLTLAGSFNFCDG
jgi:hypothetical protein